MKKCRMAAAEGRQDFPDSTFKLLNVLSSNEIRRALVKQRRPIPIILIKIRNVDVLLKNEISDRAQNSQDPFRSTSLDLPLASVSQSDEIVSYSLERVAGPVIRHCDITVRGHHVAFGKCQCFRDRSP